MGLRRRATLLLACALASCGRPTRISAPSDKSNATGALDRQVSEALAAGDLETARPLLPLFVEARERAHAGAELVRFWSELANRLAATPDATAEDLELAASLLRKAVALEQGISGERSLTTAVAWSALSDLEDRQGRWLLSEEHELLALDIRRERLGGEDPLVARSLRGLAIVLFRQGRFREARERADEAQRVLEGAAGAPAQELVEVLNVQAELARVEDRFADAEALWQRALALTGEPAEQNQSLLATLENNLTGLLRDQGRYDEAAARLGRAIALWEADPDQSVDDILSATLNRAEILRLQGRLEEADGYYGDALQRARRRYGDHDPQLNDFINQTAVLRTEQGRFDAAEKLYREGLALAARALDPAHPQVAQSLHDLARLLRLLGRNAEAEESLARALSVRETAFGRAHPDVAVTLTELGRCLFDQGPERDEAALDSVERALDILKNSPAYPEARADALALEAEILRRRGDRPGAVGAMGRALEGIEALRPRTGGSETTRAEFLARYQRFFRLMVGWQLEEGRMDAAFEFAERSRARALLDQLASAAVDLRRDIPPALRVELERRETGAKARLAEYQQRIEFTRERTDLPPEEQTTELGHFQQELDKAAGDYRSVSDELKAASPLWRGVITAGGRVVPLAEAQKRLVAGGSFILLYQEDATGTVLFLIPPAPAAATAHRLTLDEGVASVLGATPGHLTSTALDRLILEEAAEEGLARRSLQRTRAGAGLARGQEVLHALWQSLVPPEVWSRIREATEVVIVPDGSLHLLPFEALVVARTVEGGTRYWLDDGPVVRYAPSATALASLSGRPARFAAQVDDLLVVADPIFEGTAGLERLPQTAVEARAISEAWRGAGARSVRVIEGEDAQERNVRSALTPSTRFLHFATHGLVSVSHSEMLAALALTPPRQVGRAEATNDGLLQLFEIYELKLDADLAVLSACETHVGRLVRGEGAFALSRGFLAAGARGVVASLWPVNDESTALLMATFYRHVAEASKAGRVDYARALRDARRDVRQREAWAPPYFWAPFVISGAP